MPVIKLQHVVSFSSEDKVHKAENLLKSERYRKWKCATAGEKQASVILQLEKASVISSIDIGNESSAFIEVLVARSSDAAPEFQVLLVASSFMSPMDARQGTNLNRVRMFSTDKLSQTFAKEKWDRIKVVCTQPFNKSMQYGLAFITLHSPGEMDPKGGSSPKAALGGFQLKGDDDETDLAVGSWFAKRKEKERLSQDTSTSPAAIKGASFAATTLRTAEEKSLKPVPQALKKEQTKLAASTERNVASPLPKTARKPLVEQPKKAPAEKLTPKTPKSEAAKKPKAQPRFHELMKGVVFVLSGFQNPARSQIRDKALEMGAKYKGDWDRSCTHLV
ncbi:DNA repair protein XRCC1 [Ixodes scapularis]